MGWSLGAFSGDPWTDFSFAAIELLVLALAVIAVVGAWRAGREAGTQPGEYHRLWAIIAAFFLTLGLELVMTGTGGLVDDPLYEYGEGFLVLLSGVPLWVPIGWGAIIYVTMQTSDRLLSPWWLRPLMDGLLALNIDFALDPIAANFKWWIWEPVAPGEGFFGIPGGNFMAWFVIVVGLSMALRGTYHLPPLRDLTGWVGGVLPGVLSVVAIVALVAAVVVAGPLIEDVDMKWLESRADVLMIGLWVLIGAGIIVWAFPFNIDFDFDASVMAFPVLLHGLFLFLLAVMNVQQSHTELTVFIPLLALAGMAAYGWPYLGNALKRAPEGNVRNRVQNWGPKRPV